MKSITSIASVLVALMFPFAGANAASALQAVGPAADYPVVIGEPYAVGGVTYTPADTLNYDAVGYARLGSEGNGISGAHHALPLPCYVEVTSLDSGHTILVRLDHRGPMNGKQLVELSPAAWAQLGLPAKSDAPVRVRRVNPPEQERALLRTGQRAPDRMETPPGLRTALRRKLGIAAVAQPDDPPVTILSGAPAAATIRPAQAAAKPVVALPPKPLPIESKAVAPKPATPQPPAPKPLVAKPTQPKAAATEAKAPEKPATKPLLVQVAAFSSKDRAQKAATQVGGKVEAAGKLWRVRIVAGDADQARAALAKAKQSGYAGAIILHHE